MATKRLFSSTPGFSWHVEVPRSREPFQRLVKRRSNAIGIIPALRKLSYLHLKPGLRDCGVPAVAAADKA